MPLYQYQCESCNSRFEEIRNLSQRDKLSTCKQCGAGCSRILFPSAPAILKEGEQEQEEQTTEGSTAISIDGPVSGMRIENNVFMNLAHGVVADKQSQLSIKDNKFINVKVPVKRRKK